MYDRGELSTFEKMVIILEDRRFFNHGGVDLRAAIREAYKLLFSASKAGGASTIDMQFVRTATGYRDRTARRKLYEMLLSVLIQSRYPKIVILRTYLEIAYFGWRLKGAEEAATALFGIPTHSLNVSQAAMVAVLLVVPRPRFPSESWKRKALRRADYIERAYIRYEKRLDKVIRAKMS